jgi:hypothetical protein
MSGTLKAPQKKIHIPPQKVNTTLADGTTLGLANGVPVRLGDPGNRDHRQSNDDCKLSKHSDFENHECNDAEYDKCGDIRDRACSEPTVGKCNDVRNHEHNDPSDFRNHDCRNSKDGMCNVPKDHKHSDVRDCMHSNLGEGVHGDFGTHECNDPKNCECSNLKDRKHKDQKDGACSDFETHKCNNPKNCECSNLEDHEHRDPKDGNSKDHDCTNFGDRKHSDLNSHDHSHSGVCNPKDTMAIMSFCPNTDKFMDRHGLPDSMIPKLRQMTLTMWNSRWVRVLQEDGWNMDANVAMLLNQALLDDMKPSCGT